VYRITANTKEPKNLRLFGIWWGSPFFHHREHKVHREKPLKISVISVRSVVKRVFTPLKPKEPKKLKTLCVLSGKTLPLHKASY
jgi:hypothetical protein